MFIMNVCHRWPNIQTCHASQNVKCLPNNVCSFGQGLKPQQNRQALFGKRLKFCLSSTMFVGLATTQARAWQKIVVRLGGQTYKHA